MAASGALEFDGNGWPWEQPLRWCGLLDPSLFTVVIKTLTRHPRIGNLKLYKPWTCIRFLRDGSVNAVGLTNPGIEWWCKHIGPSANRKKNPLIGNIYSEDPHELAEMAKMLNPYDLVGLEINASCPNTNGDLLANTQKVIEGCRVVKSVSRFPLILKLSVVHDIQTIVDSVKDAVEALSINSVPWGKIFPDKKSPLARLGGGGVAGKVAQPFTWKLLEDLARMTTIPVVGPSVWSYEDIAEIRNRGAKAVSFGSVFMNYPWRPTLFIRKDMKHYGVESART